MTSEERISQVLWNFDNIQQRLNVVVEFCQQHNIPLSQTDQDLQDLVESIQCLSHLLKLAWEE